MSLEVKCEWCGNNFQIYPYEKGKRECCSRQCKNALQHDRRLKNETTIKYTSGYPPYRIGRRIWKKDSDSENTELSTSQ